MSREDRAESLACEAAAESVSRGTGTESETIPGKYMEHRLSCRQNTHTHKINKFKPAWAAWEAVSPNKWKQQTSEQNHRTTAQCARRVLSRLPFSLG